MGILEILLSQLNGSILLLAILLIAVLIVTYKSGSWISTLKEWKRNLDSHGNKIDELQKMSAKIDVIYQTIIPNIPTKALSPITLTKSGEEIIKEINGKEIFNRIYPQIQNDFKNECLEKNAYDIQSKAMTYAEVSIENRLNNKEIIDIKNAAFQRGLMKEDILAIFGILLRDKTLEEFNIPISDVDDHAPNNG